MRPRRLTARLALVSAVAAAGGLSTAVAVIRPASAHTDYHTASYSSPKGNAHPTPGTTTPSLDIIGVTFGYNGSYLRFESRLAAASKDPPQGFQQQDFFWRFKVDKQYVYAEYSRSLNPYIDSSTVIGTSTRNSDGTFSDAAGQICRLCYSHINPKKGFVEFFVGLEPLNTALSKTAKGKNISVSEGTKLTGLEADSQADGDQNGTSSFPADAAPAPKGLSFTI
ncbi:MAG: hypothetical protein NVS3B21_01540 [Acidimicrobiales bacterium]